MSTTYQLAMHTEPYLLTPDELADAIRQAEIQHGMYQECADLWQHRITQLTFEQRRRNGENIWDDFEIDSPL